MCASFFMQHVSTLKCHQYNQQINIIWFKTTYLSLEKSAAIQKSNVRWADTPGF